MNPSQLFTTAQQWGPVLFGVCFLAPLIAQVLDAAAWPAALGTDNLTSGLAIGTSLGWIAKRRGTWL